MNVKELLTKLKAHLADNQAKYVEHDSWLGDSELGFYSKDQFSLDKMLGEIDNFGELLAEMDEFSAQLKAEKRR